MMMRALTTLFAAGLIAAGPGLAQAEGERRLSSAALSAALKDPRGQNDSCRWAQDGECDEPGFGTGACAAGTDYSDCWRIMTSAEDDSCQWAADGECDEPRFGTGACTQGTDVTDCGDVSHLRFRDDSCESAFNGICETGAGGACAPRTDRADCVGRERPALINDHFFGRDDRRLMDTGRFPWSVIGVLETDGGGVCSASLVAPNVITTAAHCIADTNTVSAAGVFRTGAGLPGGARSAEVVDYLLDDAWDAARFEAGNEDDGADWALLRLATPLGEDLGYLRPLALVETVGEAAALGLDIHQAGYSWDTGENLSGNEDCRILGIYPDNTFAHDCDTTRGDSGSPFMVRGRDLPAAARGAEAVGVDAWYVVATDSNFRSAPDEPFIYIAARADRWAGLVEAFADGRIGAGGVRPQGRGKPKGNVSKSA